MLCCQDCTGPVVLPRTQTSTAASLLSGAYQLTTLIYLVDSVVCVSCNCCFNIQQ